MGRVETGSRRPAPRRARRCLVAAAVVVAGLLPAGCGAGRSGLTAVEQSQLLGLIRQARSAAAGGDSAGAASALGELRRTVSALRAAGVLDPARAARMQSVAAQALSAARSPAATKPAASTPPAATAPAAAPPSPATTPPAPTAPAPSNGAPAQTIIQAAPVQPGGGPALGKQKGHGKGGDKGGGGGD